MNEWVKEKGSTELQEMASWMDAFFGAASRTGHARQPRRSSIRSGARRGEGKRVRFADRLVVAEDEDYLQELYDWRVDERLAGRQTPCEEMEASRRFSRRELRSKLENPRVKERYGEARRRRAAKKRRETEELLAEAETWVEESAAQSEEAMGVASSSTASTGESSSSRKRGLEEDEGEEKDKKKPRK
ncbi:957_t:CDS:1 [Ambispora gerdemannii]|uniref:957_t:CDS:1 n=1 Tax=Ambispora gerdemannii TaxID=144530 RepID=A0A9N8W1Y5_9GLOM|nr:957_t:CDS:1 [Ambispora gerdemannii]